MFFEGRPFFLIFSHLSISESTSESLSESTPRYGAPRETVTAKPKKRRRRTATGVIETKQISRSIHDAPAKERETGAQHEGPGIEIGPVGPKGVPPAALRRAEEEDKDEGDLG